MVGQAANRVWGCASARAVIAVLCLIGGSFGPAAAAAPAAKPEARKPVPAEVTQGFNAVLEAQHTLATAMSDLREQLNELQRGVNELRDEVRQNRDALQAVMEQTKGMRDEVRGLYVESSSLKGDIAQTGKHVETLGQELGSFRLSAGIIVALVIVLQVVSIGLTFRGRS